MSEYEKWETFRMFPEEMRQLADSLAFREGRTISMLKSGQKRVRELREEIGARWPDCPPMDAWAYLVTEVGELGDALLRLGYGKRSDYVRNNEKVPDLGAELGDVYLMLCTLATAVGLDLEGALEEVIYQLRKKHRLSHEEVDEVIKRLKEEWAYGIVEPK